MVGREEKREGREGRWGGPPQTCKGTNINLATVSNLLRKCSLEGGLAQLPALLCSG